MTTSSIREPRAPAGPAPGAGPRAEPAPDPHPWRAAILLALVSTGFVMLVSFLLTPWFHSSTWWFAPADAWKPLQAAQYVANGAFGHLYEANRYFVYLPMLPIVLAPVALVQSWLRLGQSIPFPIPHPTLWIVYCPYANLVATLPLLYAVRSLAVELGVRRRLVHLQVATLALVVLPVVILWGHYEDALATALLALAAREHLRGRLLRTAVLLGFAIGFKQWAVVAVPAFVAFAPRGSRLRTLAVAGAIPLALVAIPLIVDWRDTSRALLQAQSFPALGRPALWFGAFRHGVVGTLPRAVEVGAAAAAGWLLRRGGGAPSRLVAALGCVLLLRLAFEPALFTYYLGPSMAFLLVLDLVHTGWGLRTLLLGTLATALFLLHPPAGVWWATEAALALGCALPALRIAAGRTWPVRRWPAVAT